MTRHPDDLLTVKETAEYLRVSPQTLRDWKYKNDPDQPPSVAVGRRVRYRWGDLQAYIASRQSGGSNHEQRRRTA